MNDFTFSIPQKVIVGKGSLEKVGQISINLNGKHAFIISGPNLEKMGVVSKVARILYEVSIEVDFFTDIEANPSVTTVDKATRAFIESGADYIVALGGGSPLDVAKAVAVVAKYGGSITDYEGAHRVPGKVVPMIAIPTTAGTGSEVTAFSVITDHIRDYKLTVFSYELIPDYAILDPELIMTSPASVAAACGIDAFIHAEESYISRDASPFTEAMSEKAMELIGRSIRQFVANRENEAAAEDMLLGSLFAGIAFSWARLGNVHAMSHPVSAYFDVPHGVANGILLPTIAKYNSTSDEGKYLKIYNYISVEPVTKERFKPEMLADAFRKLNAELGIPANLASVGVKEEYIKAMAEDAMKSGNIMANPRKTEYEDIVELYKDAM
ncbi:alcohol dehydrogenase [Pseudobutyrivibrio sp. YE44]|uniref:iron-containing alcohol dehydrogenase n=1 Tax=Pseudobutyrivibrio sp. YE44 TaxID=1520802 RepID=UPI00089145B3|nr:iron-containing alcohol dehydrogenase [Pseudobutyrivibrio sp. YE44]SDB47954.1 alcohol dehydrogenase [Pseudobutyrivibrio sp. YE44]